MNLDSQIQKDFNYQVKFIPNGKKKSILEKIYEIIYPPIEMDTPDGLFIMGNMRYIDNKTKKGGSYNGKEKS